MRPVGQLPRVEVLHGVEVYAPWCDNCGSDEHTEWDHLPSLAGLDHRVYGGGAEGLCLRCARIIRPTGQEARRAREPERLAARLAELRGEVRRAS